MPHPDSQKGELTAPFPHCNPNVIHAPGECIYCDDRPDLQATRTTFDPPEANGWRGNVAWTPQMVLDEAKYWDEIRDHYVNQPDGWREIERQGDEYVLTEPTFPERKKRRWWKR